MLWTAQLFDLNACPPLLSFAMGSLGFLTPFDAKDYANVLRKVIEKGCFLSVRTRIEGQIIRGDEKGEFHTALNEVVIDRGPSSTLGNLMAYCNGKELTRVQADGLIVAAPTGSTAYSLSAGGSIVHPAVPCMIFTPICPHTLSFRSMIFPDSMKLSIVVPKDSRATAWCAFDGKHRTELKFGDSINLRVSNYPVPIICETSEQDDFNSSIKDQLLWNVRVAQKAMEK